MTIQKFQLKLNSSEVKLPVLEELIGKEVEITIKTLEEIEWKPNGAAIRQIIEQYASPELFKDITDPVQWQKDLRDEWEDRLIR